ncbi:MAG: CPXCG motif-containing cysteine-rich protein [Motiliproteus sp.]
MIENVEVICPYCGEPFEATVDGSLEEQQYYEDCRICCAPILFDVCCDYEGKLVSLSCRSDSE